MTFEGYMAAMEELEDFDLQGILTDELIRATLEDNGIDERFFALFKMIGGVK